MTAPRPLRVLLLEDDADDARLILHELRRAGFAPEAAFARTEAEYLRRLGGDVDLILADNSLPQFDARRALAHLRAGAVDAPLIVVSGSISEEVAVECMREGAADYLLKDRLARLGQAVERALHDRRLRAAARQAEEARRDSEERARQVIEAALDAVVAMDAEGRIVGWNARAEAVFGWTRAEAIGRSLAETIVPARMRRAHARGLRRFLATGAGPVLNRRVELVGLHRDGREFPVELTVTPLRRDGAWSFSAFVRDITERRRAEAERARLLEAEQAARAEAEAGRQRFAVLAEASALLAASLDYETTLGAVVRLMVPGLADWCALDLLDEGGAVRRVAAAHADPAKAPLLDELARRYPFAPGDPRGVGIVLRTGRTDFRAELSDADLRGAARDGGQLALLRRLAPRSHVIVPLAARGRRLGALSLVLSDSGRRYTEADARVAEDLAGRAALAIDNARLYGAARAAEERLRALNAELARAVRLRDQFLVAAAHELKTPVAALRLGAQLLLRARAAGGSPDAGRLDERLRTIDAQAERLARLVGRLVDAARLETGELPVRPRPTDLAALARAVVAARRATAPGHALAVRAPGPVVAPVDAARFEALLGNLLDNAVKYSPAGGPVEVDVEADGAGQARVAVRDRGVGVPPERRAGLFDRFHPTPGTHLDGLGLGLYLSRRIAERHGGSIAVEHPEDGGTRVVVTLPLATPAPDGRQRAAAGPDPVPRP